MRLNLGCGSRTVESWTNVDKVALLGVDTVWDLDVGPWPWADATVSQIEARDVFEHIGDPVLFMTECHRVLKAGCSLFLRTPYWRHRDAYTDPTHRRFPTEHTFDYWLPGTVLYEVNNAAYGGVAFGKVDLHLDGGSMNVVLRKM